MPMTSQWIVRKTEVASQEGVVATMARQATEAGVEMLRRGGNAIDAAVAAGFAVGVVEPFNSGLGGIAVMVVHEAATGRTTVFDGTGTLPAATRANQFELDDLHAEAGLYGWPGIKDDANNTGWRTPAVPGTPACLLQAHERFGRLPRADVLAPAIHHAEKGFPIDWYIALGMAVNQHRLHRYPESRRVMYRPDGTVWRAPMLGVEGDTFRQPDLAWSLRQIAADGADAFYRGRIAEKIAADMAAHGGLLSADDLAGYRLRVSEGGLRGHYRGCDVVGGLENTGFPTVMQALSMLERFDLRAMGAGSLDELHCIAEAQRLAFLDRFAHLGDADSVPLPLRGLMSPGYAQERAAAIRPDRADLQATAGDPWRFEPGHPTAVCGPAQDPASAARAGEGQTTHLTVIDRDRNMVSLLSTLGQHFGSAVVARDTGIVLNNGTMWFDPIPGRVNSLAPGRRVMTAGAPVIVLRDGQPLLAVGAPGGRRVISAVLHSIVNMVDHGMGPQEAVNTPRVHCEGRTTVADVRLGDEVLAGLRHRGHAVEEREETFSTSYFGRPNAVMVQPGSGRLLGGVNQYKPTWAVGL